MTAAPRVPPAPVILRLVQAAVLGRWRATGDDLYRAVIRESELAAGQEALVSGCGEGVTAEWLCERTRASVFAVDADAERIERAERRLRRRPSPLPLTFEQAPLDDLPHENGVFDVVIGEPSLAAADDPARAIRELGRVAKPYGRVVLLQLTWNSDLAGVARDLVVERLGLRPHMVMEWKQMLRAAGVVEIEVQDWSSGPPAGAGRPLGRASGSHATIPLQGVPALTWQQKMQIAGRAWRRWGWRAGALRAARGAVESESALLRALSRDRALGFQLIKGVKWPHATAP